ncbi:transposase (plasmid) [Sphingobium fuliginis]|jgi:putative transposase|uniref:Transposase n=1 Tax=Sphingobium fuliginis (strain ATCC 27551) TaxID=336203 RepID=A0A7M2GPQ3_SPHSA|nr:MULTISPECIES: Mu transposase C-terminal domain-containing protein [Sphingobium]QOT74508.1 transposase [Sphingobium fuliginis]
MFIAIRPAGEVVMVRQRADLHGVAEPAWSRAAEREPVIRNLAAMARIPDADLRLAMDELSLGRTRLYALVKQYRTRSVASSLVDSRPGPTCGFSRLGPEVDALINGMIESFFLTDQQPNISDLWRKIAHECAARGVSKPSRHAVEVRVMRLRRAHVIRRRKGRKAADDGFRPVRAHYGAEHALQIVQIDHTLVDQIVVDERNRLPLGRPWLTIAVDVASRVVTGFYLTMDSPSATSVAMALRHAVLPKKAWLEERSIDVSWEVSGIPDCLHMDNAREFHSRALARGCTEHGIEQIFRPPATPHYGGHIERLIGTMMGAVHLLPGTTFSNIAEKGDYDPERHAAMTLAELESWIALQIAGVYHCSLHSALQLTPASAWERAVQRQPDPIRHPADFDQFLLDFLPFEMRKVRRDGVRLFHIRYWDNVLSSWVGEGLQMLIKYDPRNLSCVFLQAPDGQHLPIPYADLSRPAISHWEQKRALAELHEEGRRSVDEGQIFASIEAQRAIVAMATARTKTARKAARRMPRDDAPIITTTKAPADLVDRQAPLTSDPYLPYPMENWS